VTDNEDSVVFLVCKQWVTNTRQNSVLTVGWSLLPFNILKLHEMTSFIEEIARHWRLKLLLNELRDDILFWCLAGAEI